jgi:FMN-dependent NADH-azoreductase
MKKVLVINGYISDDSQSTTHAVVEKFLAYYQAKNPDDEIITLDLNDVPMASITLSRQNMATYFNENDSDKYIEQLKGVDKVIMASPMINFCISPLVKNYFDHILVANKTFSYKYAEKGKSKGLLDHLSVEIIVSQGSPLDWYTFIDLPKYIAGLWDFAGAKISGTILNDGTKTEAWKNQGGIAHALQKLDAQIKADAEKF